MTRVAVLPLFFLWTALVLGGGCFAGFGLWFAPGWANGWPLHRNVVWPAGLTGVAFATVLALAAGGWAAYRAEREPPRPVWPPSRVGALVSLARRRPSAW